MRTTFYTMPAVLRAINTTNDDVENTKLENIMMCMFFSPLLILSAVITFTIQFLAQNMSLWPVLLESSFFLLSGLALEALRRLDKNPRMLTHFISFIYAAVFLFVAIRLYRWIGPSIWTIGFIIIMLAMVRTTKTMLTYISVSLLLSGLYILFGQDKDVYQLNTLCYVMQFVGFTLIFIVALAMHNMIRARYVRIKEQLTEVNHQMEKRREAEEENIKLALYDQLTGLPNRTLFNERLKLALLQAMRSDTGLYVLFLDLDMFKMINDTMGHSIGDEVLAQVGRRIESSLRKSDTVARIGGDEFLILIPNIKSRSAIVNIAANLLTQIRMPYIVNNQEISFSCSIGIAHFPDDGQDVESLVKYADLAMYKAKNDGRNRFEFFSKHLEHSINYEMGMISNLQTAVERNEFEIYYQPQVNSSSGEITGLEALLRWNHPALGLVCPADFIPVAERTGLIVPIGEWVLRKACEQNKAWQDAGMICVPVSVNLSANQFRQGLLVQQVGQILKETGLAPEYLELEITERALIQELSKFKLELDALKGLGVKIAIDDFGTGYSSIQYLKELPVDKIKIPIDFVRGIDEDVKDESIITVILALAENLNLDVIAEGVETKNQLQFLNNRKCNSIQGFYFFRPMRTRDIESHLDKRLSKRVKNKAQAVQGTV